MHAADPNVDTRCYAAEPAGHAHDFHQVVLGGDGGTELEVDGHLHRVDAGAGLVIPAGTRHDYRGLDAANRQLVVDLPAASVALPASLFRRPPAFVNGCSGSNPLGASKPPLHVPMPHYGFTSDYWRRIPPLSLSELKFAFG